MTALELAGYWHYAPLGRRRVWLYTDAPAVRSYLRRMDLDADIDIRSRKLFDDADLDLELEARILDLASNALGPAVTPGDARRSEEHTSELQSLMRNSYAVICLNKKNQQTT